MNLTLILVLIVVFIACCGGILYILGTAETLPRLLLAGLSGAAIVSFTAGADMAWRYVGVTQ